MANDILLFKSGTGLKDYISALVEPVQTSSDLLNVFEADQTKRARFNGRKIVLQAALNDIFGVISPPYILIETNQDISVNTFFYEPAELIDVFFYEPSEVNGGVFIFEVGELLPEDYDFKVLIPVGIWTLELERRVRAETTLYKLAGKQFIIEQY